MPKKQSFSEIQQVSRKDTLRNVLIIGLVLVALVAAGGVFRMINAKDETAAPEQTVPDLPPVPTSIRYYDASKEETYSTGIDYIILTDSGQRIKVSADGSVYLVNSDGSEIRLLTGTERDETIRQALEIQKYDPEVNIALSGLDDIVSLEKPEPEPTIVEEPTTEEMIKAIVEGRGLTMDSFNDMIYQSGTNPAQFMRIASGKSEDELNTLISATIDTAERQGGASGPTLSANVEGISIQPDNMVTDTAASTLPDWLQPIDPAASMSALVSAMGTAAGESDRSMTWDAVNQNSAQASWLEKEQSRETTQSRIDDHYLAAGTVVPITIVTGIDTDLPGDVVGLVRQDVYDTLTGRNVLIPKGSRLLASYNNSVAFGQKSVQIAWNQLLTPDGYVFTLPGFQGVDGEGYSGNRDRYNSHFWEMLGGAMLGSIINYGAGYLSEQASLASDVLTGTDVLEILAGSAIDTTVDFMDEWVNLIMNRQPTIKIRPGYQTQLLVNQNINLRRTLD